ncbi:hypothetical protein B296_00051225 [Ensete ventricosum]|uniref:Uncharacterized protein n=1 Tax=Ensete ventricosum TaxID=4639 RepID=A0A426X268_ENSVE|nr:hypothetical protein B296_00051225 [Ensete ventricosum]
MTSSDSLSSVRVVSSPGSGETSPCDPEVGSSGASSRPPSLVNVRVLRDLKVMKSDHDLDTVVTEGSHAVIRERYSIPVEYRLHVPQPEQRPYSNLSGCSGGRSSISSASTHRRMHEVVEDLHQPGSAQLVALPCRLFGRAPRSRDYPDSGLVHGVLSPLQESGRLLPHCPIWGFRLDWSAHPINNASPYLSEEETILVERLKEILSSSRAIKEMTELWLVEAGLSPASRARRHKKVKVLTRRHKSRVGEGESRSQSKGKEPAAPSEEPETPAGSGGGASPAHRRPRSMKDLFKTNVHKDDACYYTLLMSDLGHQDPEKEMKARWKGLMNSTNVWNNSSAVQEGTSPPPIGAGALYTLVGIPDGPSHQGDSLGKLPDL